MTEKRCEGANGRYKERAVRKILTAMAVEFFANRLYTLSKPSFAVTLAAQSRASGSFGFSAGGLITHPKPGRQGVVTAGRVGKGKLL